MPRRRVPPAEVVRAWVDGSCTEAGLPVRVTDATVVAGVAALLGASPRPAGGVPSVPPHASQLPDGGEAAGVESVEAASSGGDGDVEARFLWPARSVISYDESRVLSTEEV